MLMRRNLTFGKVACSLATLATFVSGLWPQSIEKDITYRARGDRWEGTIQPKKSGNKIELMSAMVDYEEGASTIPLSVAIRFYLTDKSPVSVSVRGIRVAQDYWMNQVRPTKDWAPGFGNEFRWATSDVIQKLSPKIESIYDFGVLVCLDRDCDTTDNLIMKVAPAVLYYSDFPKSLDGYRLTFKPIARESLTFNLYADLNGNPTGAPIQSQVFPDVPAGVPFNVQFKAPTREGWYQLRVQGVTRYDNEDVAKTIRFYHAQVRAK
jgi:hypothetical protein